MSWLDTPNVPVPGSRDVSPSAMSPLGYVQLTGVTTVQSLKPPSGASIALIQAESVDFRWADDGSIPTASVGMTLAAGTTLAYTGNLNNLKLIPTTGTGIINISYYN